MQPVRIWRKQWIKMKKVTRYWSKPKMRVMLSILDSKRHWMEWLSSSRRMRSRKWFLRLRHLQHQLKVDWIHQKIKHRFVCICEDGAWTFQFNLLRCWLLHSAIAFLQLNWILVFDWWSKFDTCKLSQKNAFVSCIFWFYDITGSIIKFFTAWF